MPHPITMEEEAGAASWCRRTRLSPPPLELSSISEWRLSYVNQEFAVCPSYPPAVTVPKAIDDDALRKVATFRHGGRFPVLSYYHKKNGMVSEHCSMVDWKIWEGASILIHGTEGTDSTLQVTSLAQIILEPRSRTIRGFEALIEREWLQAGHPFQQRCAQSAYCNSKQKWESPVFLLFLDCVWQILRQFPCSFEFNENFLIMLFEHAYASQFGTFLGNNESERCKLKLQQKTMSLWSWVNRPSELSKFTNPLFEANNLVIWPSVAPQSLQLWEGIFLRWNRSSKYLDEAYEEMVNIIEYNKQLQAKVNLLRRQLAELETEDGVQESP
ncbi:MTMR9 [Cervus elaphus hippelaphus]|uniref:MTMR9 n=1 Tax=Cervus elaphus hippelaphus TaxID=46360 RepID=A0A212C5I9_CEREH|nr:MTMR9 [Cervus elaphus hippelaphus]